MPVNFNYTTDKLIDNMELVNLHEFGLTLNLTHNLDQILRESAASIRSILEADSCHIFLDKSLVSELKLEAVVYHDNKSFLPEVKYKSFLSVPIITAGVIVGDIAVYSCQPAKFIERHEEFLTMLGSHLGLALENSRLMMQLRNAAFTDSLTGAYNHRHFRNELEFILTHQPQSLVSLIMLDVNDLKIINDTYGHTTGDRVLQEITQVLTQNVRSMDIVSRYGGDEFAIILPGADMEEALNVAKRVEQAVAECRFILDYMQPSVSWGAITTRCEEVTDVNSFIDMADRRLYNMKKTKKG